MVGIPTILILHRFLLCWSPKNHNKYSNKKDTWSDGAQRWMTYKSQSTNQTKNDKEVDGMSSNHSIEQKREVAEQLWLLYFNRTLYDQNLITEAERNRLHNMITNRRPSAVKR